MTNLKLDLHDKLSDADWLVEIASVFADFETAIRIEANFSPAVEQMLLSDSSENWITCLCIHGEQNGPRWSLGKFCASGFSSRF